MARSRREAFWRQLTADWQREGVTQAEFCLRRGVVKGTFAWWRRQIRLRDAAATKTSPSAGVARRPDSRVQAASRFVPVRVVPSEACGERNPAPIEIVLAGSRRVRVAAGFDPDALAAVLRLLEALPC